MVEIEEVINSDKFDIFFDAVEKFNYRENRRFLYRTECFIRLTKSDLELLYSCLSEKINKVEKPEINFLPIDTGD